MYTLNAVKLRNQLNALAPEEGLDIHLQNVRINGVLQGCSGFVYNPNTETFVYVSTDRNHDTVRNALYRTAKNRRDYTGGTNRFAEWDELAEKVLALSRGVR